MGAEGLIRPGALVSRRSLSGVLRPWTRAGSHRFPDDPSYAFALLQDPGRARRTSPWRSCRRRPRSTQTEGLSGYIIARLTQGFSFRWKDYRHHNKSKLMTLSADEFIRRFLLHALPDGFHRIRHYGLFANGRRVAKLAHCRLLLAAPTPPSPSPTADYHERYRCLTGRSLDICPSCGGTMAPFGPPSCTAPTWPDTS